MVPVRFFPYFRDWWLCIFQIVWIHHFRIHIWLFLNFIFLLKWWELFLFENIWFLFHVALVEKLLFLRILIYISDKRGSIIPPWLLESLLSLSSGLKILHSLEVLMAKHWNLIRFLLIIWIQIAYGIVTHSSDWMVKKIKVVGFLFLIIIQHI